MGHSLGAARLRRRSTGIAEIDSLRSALIDDRDRIDELLARERSFSSQVSHQLRTPVTAMRVAIETERQAPRSDSTLVLDETIGQLDRLESTIASLLAFARHRRARRDCDLLELVTAHSEHWIEPTRLGGRTLTVDGDPMRATIDPKPCATSSTCCSTTLLLHGRAPAPGRRTITRVGQRSTSATRVRSARPTTPSLNRERFVARDRAAPGADPYGVIGWRADPARGRYDDVPAHDSVDRARTLPDDYPAVDSTLLGGTLSACTLPRRSPAGPDSGSPPLPSSPSRCWRRVRLTPTPRWRSLPRFPRSRRNRFERQARSQRRQCRPRGRGTRRRRAARRMVSHDARRWLRDPLDHAEPDTGASADLEIGVPPDAQPGDYPMTVTAHDATGGLGRQSRARRRRERQQRISLTADFPSLSGDPDRPSLHAHGRQPDADRPRRSRSIPLLLRVGRSPPRRPRRRRRKPSPSIRAPTPRSRSAPRRPRPPKPASIRSTSRSPGPTAPAARSRSKPRSSALPVDARNRRPTTRRVGPSRHRAAGTDDRGQHRHRRTRAGQAGRHRAHRLGSVVRPGQVEGVQPGETAQVAAVIKPAADAVAGDYALTVRASAGSLASSADLRYTLRRFAHGGDRRHRRDRGRPRPAGGSVRQVRGGR